jgi:hypothetical protein
MYAMIRSYDGISDAKGTGKAVMDSFVPLVKNLPGFVDYYFVDTGNGTMVSVSVYKDKNSAEESTRLAAEWVREHPNLIPEGAEVAGGEVVSFGDS